MTLVILDKETQKDFVRRILTERGHISVAECLWELQNPRGYPRAITRLAAIIHTLRHDEGLPIEESAKPGHTAVYTLIRPGQQDLWRD